MDTRYKTNMPRFHTATTRSLPPSPQVHDEYNKQCYNSYHHGSMYNHNQTKNHVQNALPFNITNIKSKNHKVIMYIRILVQNFNSCLFNIQYIQTMNYWPMAKRQRLNNWNLHNLTEFNIINASLINDTPSTMNNS